MPHRAAEAGRLFLWFPVPLATLRASLYLRHLGRPFAKTYNGALAIDAPEGFAEELLVDLSRLLSSDEITETRYVFKPGTGDVDVDDIARIRALGHRFETESSSWLVDLLRGGRLTSVFQPIVHAGQPTKVFGHEAFVRGLGYDGSTTTPARLFDAARSCGMVTQLDAAAHRSAIRAAATRDSGRRLFLNFTADTIRDGASCLAATFHAIDAASIRREDVVLEVTDSEETRDLRHLRTVLDQVRDAGIKVALDDVGCGERSRRLVHEIRPDYVKVDMREVRAVAGTSVREAERLFDLARHLKIETIAEGVETHEELDWNRQFGATYVQGFFIARPAALSSETGYPRIV